MKDREYYHILTKKLKYPAGNFINGSYMSAQSGETLATINPATNKVLTTIAASNEFDVNAAVANAREVFNSGVWSELHPSKRKSILLHFSHLIRENLEELAVLESLDSGKPIADCLNVDVPETANCIAWHGEAQDKLYDQISPSGNDALGMIVREPIGVVGAVLPWNFPLLMTAWKLGPALATGNSVVVKPSEMTSLSTLRLAELALEAGIPPGVFNVVTGTGAAVGSALGLHHDVDAISFTGSTATGRRFLEYSAQSNMKRVVLETGGKSPCVVFEDADLDRVAEHLACSFLGNMGQTCTANTRLIVHNSCKEALLSRLKVECDKWKIGDPLDPQTRLGPLVSKEHLSKVTSLIQKGRDEGAEVIFGGDLAVDTGYFLSPIIFDNVNSNMTVSREEIFGPVLSVLSFDTEEQAISLANDTEYGLAASLFTNDLTRTHRLSRKIQAGTVSVNCYSEGDISTPFGGYKLSGFGGKDNGVDAHDQYSEKKTIWIDLSS
ncbi:aldehyde dehydrogenase [Oceanimonas doudoroffii]|uniref:Aldehyde dehydrogenase n=1 Tax=Oceanimonas doudoroffii TaxID=84158 RepID=A0A233RIH1_9GAMM|nr:aldehyde dehydrogenase [Oceanimonas doudoroffii]OXY83195.1 aldehyde dehydrogenase [Oceanimonas doudoroffii]